MNLAITFILFIVVGDIETVPPPPPPPHNAPIPLFKQREIQLKKKDAMASHQGKCRFNLSYKQKPFLLLVSLECACLLKARIQIQFSCKQLLGKLLLRSERSERAAT